MTVSHIAYRKLNGRDYVTVDHATAEVNAMADDTLEAVARMVDEWGPKTDGLAAAIRELKRNK